MEQSVYVGLPFLHCQEDFKSFPCYRLWPGLPELPNGYWLPADYPLSQSEALQFFEELKNMGLRDYESLIINTKPQYLYNELAKHRELADLAKFKGAPLLSDCTNLIRENAHKVILWQWLLESFQQQIRELENICEEYERRLPFLFGEPEIPSEYIKNNIKKNEIARFPGNWKTLIANAMIFIPGTISVLLDPCVLDEIMEFPELAPENWQKMELYNREDIYKIETPLWRILGHTRPLSSGDSFLDGTYNKKRVWLGKL